VTRTRCDAVPPGDQFAEAARMLRAVLDALPPTSARERASARRIEGAAITLDPIAWSRVPTRLEP